MTSTGNKDAEIHSITHTTDNFPNALTFVLMLWCFAGGVLGATLKAPSTDNPFRILFLSEVHVTNIFEKSMPYKHFDKNKRVYKIANVAKRAEMER